MYLCMRTIHGIYITYTFFRWLSEGTLGTMLWLFTFIYNPYEQKQLLDKETKEEELKIEIFDEITDEITDEYSTEDPKKNLY